MKTIGLISKPPNSCLGAASLPYVYVIYYVLVTEFALYCINEFFDSGVNSCFNRQIYKRSFSEITLDC